MRRNTAMLWLIYKKNRNVRTFGTTYNQLFSSKTVGFMSEMLQLELSV